jgi:hypothetical protein
MLVLRLLKNNDGLWALGISLGRWFKSNRHHSAARSLERAAALYRLLRVSRLQPPAFIIGSHT